MIRTVREANSPEVVIAGVEFKALQTFPDERGFFREVVRKTDSFFADGFAQWSHSKMAQNTVKAWHFHHRQTDWWYCPIGLIQTVLFDNRQESPTYRRKMEFLLGDAECSPDALCTVVRIPPGVLHGCKVLHDGSHLFYITSTTYDPEDEGRYPFDDPSIPHQWGDSASLIVTARDRRLFVPSAPRRLCGE